VCKTDLYCGAPFAFSMHHGAKAVPRKDQMAQSVVWTKVRLENARELEHYRSSVRMRPDGRVELKYPATPWPGLIAVLRVCACCGKRAETQTLVRSGRLPYPHGSITTVHTIPSCEVCKRHQEALDASLMGDQCTGVRFVKFKRDTKGVFNSTPVDIFQFSNREYARQFCELNGGKLE
jgi:hypothetical protein